MNKLQRRRLIFILILICGISISAAFILYALQQNINVFLTPSQLTSELSSHYHLRLGGMVKVGSVVHETEGLGVKFTVTDLKREIPVRYVGVLPDLFRENKGVIVEGTIKDGLFVATQVLAKHDENYMPKNVYQALRKEVA